MAFNEFKGRIGRDWRDSEPWWPPEPMPAKGTPNVLLVVLDDVGYAQLGCYGSDIETPYIDSLAQSGVRFANFHTTALCSPTRACILTGRNHHRSGMGRVSDLAVAFPGYWGKPPKENGYLSEVLRGDGYATYAVGKWHLTPDDEVHMAAPRATWPLSRGFDRWYGFHGGETNQFAPALYHDNHSVRPPRSFESGYHLTEDLVDNAITFLGDLRSVDVDRPFFLYFATGACHSPHQPPRHWLERYRGHFDKGWDRWREEAFQRQIKLGLFPSSTELSPRPPWVRPWDGLSQTEQQVAARFMESLAGFLSHTDEQIGRLLEFIADLGELDNTIVVVVSDNGASAEGGPDGSINDVRMTNLDPADTAEMHQRIEQIGGPLTHNNYPWGWTMAGNAPFRRWKREVHEGGVADPCIVRWPLGGLDEGGLRHQFTHATDIMPTILSLVGVSPPEVIESVVQSELDGISFSPLLSESNTSAPEVHETQYFEIFGSRGIYHRGWKAVTYHPIAPLYDDQNPNASFDDDKWELYNVKADPTEVHDLAEANPDLLKELIRLWWREAERNQVLPLDNRVLWALVHPKPASRTPREHYRYFPNGAQVPERVAVNVRNRSHSLKVEVTIPEGTRASGVLLALGSALGGWSLHFLDGRPRYVHNLYGKERMTIESPHVVFHGRHSVEYSFVKGDGLSGTGSLLVDGLEVARGQIARFTPSGFNGVGVGITCGYEWGPAVGGGYEAPFEFNGSIISAFVETKGEASRDPLAEIEALLSEQ